MNTNHHDLHIAVDTLTRRIAHMAQATQQDIDLLTAQIQQIAADLELARTTLQAGIDTLATNGLNIINLQAAVAPLNDRIKELADLQPTQPNPPTSPEQP